MLTDLIARCRDNLRFAQAGDEVTITKESLVLLVDAAAQAQRAAEAVATAHALADQRYRDMIESNTYWNKRDEERGERLEAAEQEVARLTTELEMARIQQRFGTPFDPTGAKTGIEIQGLRASLAAAEQRATAEETRAVLALAGMKELARQLEAAEQRGRQLEAALRYADHLETCVWWQATEHQRYQTACDCGFAAARAALAQPTAGAPVATFCQHCGGRISIRNPSGHCDHLYYPANCDVCLAISRACWWDAPTACPRHGAAVFLCPDAPETR